MIGVEMVEDSTSHAPMTKERFAVIWEQCKDMGLLLGKGGFHGNVSMEVFMVM